MRRPGQPHRLQAARMGPRRRLMPQQHERGAGQKRCHHATWHRRRSAAGRPAGYGRVPLDACRNCPSHTGRSPEPNGSRPYPVGSGRRSSARTPPHSVRQANQLSSQGSPQAQSLPQLDDRRFVRLQGTDSVRIGPLCCRQHARIPVVVRRPVFYFSLRFSVTDPHRHRRLSRSPFLGVT